MYDPYYETRVTPIWGIKKTGMAIGALLLAFGVILNIFTIVDLSTGFFGIDTPTTRGVTQQTMGLWPWFGRASWVGLLVMAAGIAGIVSNKEATNCSIYGFIATAMASIFFCAYLIVCESIVINWYAGNFPDLSTDTITDEDFRTRARNELAMTCLNLIFAIFTILAAFAGSMAACGAVGCCRSRRRTAFAPVPRVPIAPHTTRPVIYRR